MWSTLSRKFLQWYGWSIYGAHHVHSCRYSVLVVAPHTSNWDFALGMLVRSATKLNTKYLGKSDLFKFPLGYIFKWLGGYPVDRSKHNNLVEAIVEIFRQHESFSIAIAPEGTRSKVDRLKTGFYHIARKGSIPIVLVSFDYVKKEIWFSEPMLTSDNFKDDMSKIYRYFDGVIGKNPEKGFLPPPK